MMMSKSSTNANRHRRWWSSISLCVHEPGRYVYYNSIFSRTLKTGVMNCVLVRWRLSQSVSQPYRLPTNMSRPLSQMLWPRSLSLTTAGLNNYTVLVQLGEVTHLSGQSPGKERKRIEIEPVNHIFSGCSPAEWLKPRVFHTMITATIINIQPDCRS